MANTTIVQLPYLELDNQGAQVRFELTQSQHILGRDHNRCDLCVPETWKVISGCHAVIKRVESGYQIFDGDGQNPSTNGLFLGQTRITSTDGYHLQNKTLIRIGQNPKNQIQLIYRNPALVEPVTTDLLTPQAIALDSARFSQQPIVIGRDPNANFQLDSPIVSRRHALVIEQPNQGYVIQDCSANGIFANGQKVNGSIALNEGLLLNIGPFTLLVEQEQLKLVDAGTQIRLDATQLVRKVKDQTGAERRLLDDISLAIEPGQFVALVGGSGAGKSTLMRTLLGIEPITAGKVLLNGNDLHSNFNIYRNQIGYVPQDDIIHRDLTVTEVLTYAAQLRLPPDANLRHVVETTLEQIEMGPRRHVLVSQLSGGQRKRISIGVELLADPKLFFLDEPTSGLDPGLDKKMMQLLRKLADQGRTIILVTHATSNINLCDRIAFLGFGGRLCYFGPPQAAGDFFEIQGDFADIYNELEKGEDSVQHWANRYYQSKQYQQYVTAHLSLNASATRFKQTPNRAKPSPIQQIRLLVQRYTQLILRDRVSLLLSMLTAPIGIMLILLANQDQQPLVTGSEADPNLAGLALKVLFVFTCAAIWIGLAGSLQEIVKEKAIYTRERLVNLGIPAYISSKVMVLGGLAIVQTGLMCLVVLIGFEAPTPEFIPWALGLSITSWLTIVSSFSLGLMVSSLVKNASQANSALPLLLLPQIIFSGVLFESVGIAKAIGWLMLSRWSIGAYGALVNINAMIPAPTTLPDGSQLKMPISTSSVYEANWSNLMTNWGVLLIMIVIYLSVASYIQKRKDLL
ncbi:ATP-binding cassette domain-containing protein [filamentous cyanobacterium LEGE 11480]|uniref:ATP-binding cassette domain-containing protein n=1 Tax=Romeriopsis navalis LEGE 11480 TaxID=2777977 RepID=A0A928Z4S5_9CYAN|nr:ATP-binding cassette domain-containing protein [Romeriopsis navalis]MBE9032059.1 ATP-binding cassette domain-containing protein [Romeriopsis navalis LEGE 11480]